MISSQLSIMSKVLLIIFIKNPMYGRVKTRLAATLGNDKALQVYQVLLQHTHAVTKELQIDKAVFYADFIDEGDIWMDANFKKFKQEGNDLGEKMEGAFLKGFSMGYEKICIIGSDCYEINKTHILKAFEELNDNTVVLGPSNDGGYYLLGMKKMVHELFYNKLWSTPSVFQETLKNIETLNLKYATLEKLNDIDEEKDIPIQIKRMTGII